MQSSDQVQNFLDTCTSCATETEVACPVERLAQRRHVDTSPIIQH